MDRRLDIVVKTREDEEEDEFSDMPQLTPQGSLKGEECVDSLLPNYASDNLISTATFLQTPPQNPFYNVAVPSTSTNRDYDRFQNQKHIEMNSSNFSNSLSTDVAQTDMNLVQIQGRVSNNSNMYINQQQSRANTPRVRGQKCFSTNSTPVKSRNRLPLNRSTDTLISTATFLQTPPQNPFYNVAVPSTSTNRDYDRFQNQKHIEMNSSNFSNSLSTDVAQTDMNLVQIQGRVSNNSNMYINQQQSRANTPRVRGQKCFSTNSTPVKSRNRLPLNRSTDTLISTATFLQTPPQNPFYNVAVPSTSTNRDYDRFQNQKHIEMNSSNFSNSLSTDVAQTDMNLVQIQGRVSNNSNMPTSQP